MMQGVVVLLFLALTKRVHSDFTLDVLHINDLHSRFEQTNTYSGRCTPVEEEQNKCFGGIARIATKVNELRNSLDNVIFLNGGDNYKGTAWYTVHKWKAFAYFLSLLDTDVMVLGNHEFDDDMEGIIPFLENVTFPVLGTNIDDSREPDFQGETNSSVILERGGRRIGVIGYVTKDTAESSSPGDLIFTDEVEAVRNEAVALKSAGVDIIIALGHSGIEIDKDIAANVQDVDLVVGAHTHTFLYTGDNPSTEMKKGDYPVVVTQSSGKKVPVVQAYAFSKYLGHLEITFDDQGEATEWNGNPILLDGSIPQDPYILEQMEPWLEVVDEESNQPIGRTYVFLNGNRDSCRLKECNLGNLVADAYVYQAVKYPDDDRWSKAGIAVANGGGIRASIDEKAYNGSITMEDIITIQPFENTIDIVELRGEHLLQMFEACVANIDGASPSSGSFLQVSGIHVVYDLTRPANSRVVSLEVRCTECRIPVFEPIDEQKVYSVIMPSYLSHGGSDFGFIEDERISLTTGDKIDAEVVMEYINHTSPIYQGLENRIQFVTDSKVCTKGMCASRAPKTQVETQRNREAYETISEPASSSLDSGSWSPQASLLLSSSFVIHFMLN